LNGKAGGAAGSRVLIGRQSRWALIGALLVLSLALPAGTAVADVLARQADGKIVLVGKAPQRFQVCAVRKSRCQTSTFGVPAAVRFDSDGNLDRAFGTGGAAVDFRYGLGRAGFSAVAIQPDGRIVTGVMGGKGFRLAGFATDGRIDSLFGNAGIATGSAFYPSDARVSETVTAVVARSDGSLAAGGTMLSGVKGAYLQRAGVMLFGEDGKESEEVGRIASGETAPEGVSGVDLTDLVERADGSLIMAGSANDYFEWRGALARFVPGSGAAYDRSFGAGAGLATFPSPAPPGLSASADAIASGGNGLVAAGSVFGGQFMLARFTQDGTLDKGFGGSGTVFFTFDGAPQVKATAVALQPDGKVVFGGVAEQACPAQTTLACWRPLVGRVNADGSIDTTFAEGGFARLPELAVATVGQPVEVGVSALGDGRILVAEVPTGDSQSFLAEDARFALWRFQPNGGLDPTFGEGGMATAEPCQGGIRRRRRSGCIATARVALRPRSHVDPRRFLRLRVSSNQPLDPIAAVRVSLPPGLRIRTGRERRIRAVGVGAGKPTLAISPRRIGVSRLGVARGLVLDIPRGVLRFAGPRPAGHKLVFRVEIQHRDGSTQRFRLRRS
jgi:uncharacterized delta-60 repeat protein